MLSMVVLGANPHHNKKCCTKKVAAYHYATTPMKKYQILTLLPLSNNSSCLFELR